MQWRFLRETMREMTADGVRVCDIWNASLGVEKLWIFVSSIDSVGPLLWSRCQLCWEELSDGPATSHSDAQWGVKKGGRVADTSPVNSTRSLFFLSLRFSLPPSTLLVFTPLWPPSISPPPQAQTSPQSLCPSPPSWWAMSMTLWCCLRLVCPTGRNCCWIPSAPSGTLGTWWFVLTTRPCSAAPRASSETSPLSTR